jgi:hypothetical protein
MLRYAELNISEENTKHCLNVLYLWLPQAGLVQASYKHYLLGQLISLCKRMDHI